MTLDELNALPAADARAALRRCCGAAKWIDGLLARRPFADREALERAADEVWWSLGEDDWREAFTHHPRIGDVEGLRKRYASTRAWAEGEQAGATAAPEDVLRALADGNRDYEARFGHIFIVCATGKSAAEMLDLLRARIDNAPGDELRVAAGEQAKITRIRITKLLSPDGGGP